MTYRLSKTLMLGTAIAVISTTAHAQLSDTDDIIVTARKRNETSIAVPVILTAVSGAQLQDRGTNTFDGLARLVPGLTIADGGSTNQGGTIALRGVAGPDTNPAGDQAVSFNIDGVQVAKSSVRRIGFMDLEQVEVLKGPQALFFGKNSPGGIISVRSADPTPHFAAKASLGYELNAHEWRGDGYISGPLSDTVGVRLAFYGSDMRGWVKNIVPRDNAFAPKHRFGPRSKEYAVRGTIKADLTERFKARLKLTYGQVRGDALNSGSQTISCPYGSSQLVGIVDDCRADERNNRGDIGTAFTPYDARFGDGVPFAKVWQFLGGLELNYALSDDIDLTSVTGYYRTAVRARDHFTRYNAPGVVVPLTATLSGPPQVVSLPTYGYHETSEEIRITSNFDQLNFTVGGIYSKARGYNGVHAFFIASPPVGPFEILDSYVVHAGEAYSAFGQLRWNVVPTLELAAGGRYSHEVKTIPLLLKDATLSRTTPISPAVPPVNRDSFNDFSPEVTATWRPLDTLTVFGSYKRGFLSGGFNTSNISTATVGVNYGPQKIRGFEAGIKAALLDRALRVNFSLYKYKALGLQVTAFTPNTTLSTIRNVGEASIKGAELDLNYRTPLDGLVLRGALTYNRGRYVRYEAPCYSGQSQAMGCNLRIVNGRGTLWDASGHRMINSPDWSGNVGFSYESPISSSLKLGLSTDLSFAGSYPTIASLKPDNNSPSRALLDASLRLADARDQWEVALIGRNLTNDFYWSSSQQQQFTGGAAGLSTPGAKLADGVAVPNRAREVMLRVTYKM